MLSIVISLGHAANMAVRFAFLVYQRRDLHQGLLDTECREPRGRHLIPTFLHDAGHRLHYLDNNVNNPLRLTD